MPQHEELVRVLPPVEDAPRPRNRPSTVIALLTLAMLGSIAFFLTWGVNGHWDFALPRRLEQLAALIVVGVAVAISTVAFQTLTENRILTPSIMGFDALYVLLAASLVFTLGGMTYQSIPDLPLFLINTTLLVVVSVILYQWVFRQTSHGLYTLILVGVIAATLFGSITSFMFRVMDPNEFEVLMTALFATFNQIDTDVLMIAGILLVSPDCTVEQIWAVKRIATLYGAELSGFSDSYIREGDGDDYLIKDDKAANRKSLELLDIDATKEGFSTALNDADLLVNFNNDLFYSGVDEELVPLLDATETIAICSHDLDLFKKASMVIPVASYSEYSGTIINAAGVLQRFDKAVRKNDDPKDIIEITRLLGGAIADAQRAWPGIRQSVEALSEIDPEQIPAEGLKLHSSEEANDGS